MKALPADIGITVVYEPEQSPILDIVFVHGLQGHPYRTWTRAGKPKTLKRALPVRTKPGQEDKPTKRRRVRQLLSRWGGITGRSRTGTASTLGPEPSVVDPSPEVDVAGDSSTGSVFWPADLLPTVCPRARVLVYGYDTKVTNYMASPTNKNSIYSHAKDLLFALSRETEPQRLPLSFVAHSLGGIVVKEMLARSSASAEPGLASIVQRTEAIIFLGTPHRGSPDFAAAGDWAQSLLSSCGIETTPSILQALGLRTTDLERAQEAFSALWNKQNFRVKTFQEGRGLTGIGVGILGDKVVPDYSSSLGDEREHAETIDANHREMCRFTGDDDPGYRKVSGELQSFYKCILEKVQHGEPRPPTENPELSAAVVPSVECPEPLTEGEARSRTSIVSFDLRGSDANEFTKAEQACLRSLRFANMNTRGQSVKVVTGKTCTWLFEHRAYDEWYTGRGRERVDGLLRLKGKPGSGKSVLMKAAYRRTLRERGCAAAQLVAAFFFNAEGTDLEKSTAGAFRSILYQLLLQDRDFLSKISQRRGGKTAWSDAELEQTLRDMLLRKGKRAFIFIDALDECETYRERRQHADFWREITGAVQSADTGANVHVLISSRESPIIQLPDCPEIPVDRCNTCDIAAYVEQRLKLSIAADEPNWPRLRDAVISKSDGVFLWAVLAVDVLIDKWEQGECLRSLLSHLDDLPDTLRELFSRIFMALDPKPNDLTMRLFQWAVLSVRPLRLHEWHHILAFIRDPVPQSLSAWRNGGHFTETDDQLERKIRSLSGGLLEVTSGTTAATSADDPIEDAASIYAGAGSFASDHGETRIVRIIHWSVRQFLLSYVFVAKESLHWNMMLGKTADVAISRGDGHISIMNTCLDYLRIKELDALVEARRKAAVRTTSGGSRTEDVRDEIRLCEAEPEEAGKGFQSHVGAEGIDTLQWIAGVARESSIHGGTQRRPSTASLSTVKTEVLEDYPALLPYVVDELFNHARLAWKSRVSLESVFARLGEQDTWSRWLALSEDKLAEPDFAVYLQKELFYQTLMTEWLDSYFGVRYKEFEFQPRPQRPPDTGLGPSLNARSETGPEGGSTKIPKTQPNWVLGTFPPIHDDFTYFPKPMAPLATQGLNAHPDWEDSSQYSDLDLDPIGLWNPDTFGSPSADHDNQAGSESRLQRQGSVKSFRSAASSGSFASTTKVAPEKSEGVPTRSQWTWLRTTRRISVVGSKPPHQKLAAQSGSIDKGLALGNVLALGRGVSPEIALDAEVEEVDSYGRLGEQKS